MKICLVTNIYEPYRLGGTEAYLKWLTEALAQKGHEVFVITTCPAGKSFLGVVREVVNRIKVYRFYPWNIYWGYRAQEKPLFLKPLWHLIEFWNPQVYLKVKSILAQEQPDVVHIHNMGGFSNSVFRACKKSGHKVIYTLHDYLSLCPKSILLKYDHEICTEARLPCKTYRTMKRLALRRNVDLFISPSAFARQLHQKNGVVGKAECRLVPLCVETNGTGPCLRQNMTRGGEETITLLYVGQIVRHKGLSILAQALKEVARDDLSLHLAGLGEYTEPLQREMRQINNVTFHGYVCGQEKASLFQRSNAFVLPSVCYDNAPLTVLEAYTYGLPVIASRIGGIPELVSQGKTGYLFEPGDVRQLVSILQNISKERLQSMALACQAMAMNYSTAKHLNRLLAIYSEVVRSGAQINKEYDPGLRESMHLSEEREK